MCNKTKIFDIILVVLNRSNNKNPIENSKPAIPSNKNVNEIKLISLLIMPKVIAIQYKISHIISEKKINIIKMIQYSWEF